VPNYEPDQQRGQLPYAIQQHVSSAWLERFRQCFYDLEQRLAACDFEYLADCTAEEWALHLVIEMAKADWIDSTYPESAMADLPEYEIDSEDPEEWGGYLLAMLLPDTDVLMLDDRPFDGIEDDNESLRLLGIGDQLGAEDWFTPFSSQ
jgi:hypothetical protein